MHLGKLCQLLERKELIKLVKALGIQSCKHYILLILKRKCPGGEYANWLSSTKGLVLGRHGRQYAGELSGVADDRHGAFFLLEHRLGSNISWCSCSLHTVHFVFLFGLLACFHYRAILEWTLAICDIVHSMHSWNLFCPWHQTKTVQFSLQEMLRTRVKSLIFLDKISQVSRLLANILPLWNLLTQASVFHCAPEHDCLSCSS